MNTLGAVAALMAGATVVEGLSENNSVSPRESPSGHPIIVKCLPTTSRFRLKQMKSDACPRTMRPAINLTRRGKSMFLHASIFRLLINLQSRKPRVVVAVRSSDYHYGKFRVVVP